MADRGFSTLAAGFNGDAEAVLCDACGNGGLITADRHTDQWHAGADSRHHSAVPGMGDHQAVVGSTAECGKPLDYHVGRWMKLIDFDRAADCDQRPDGKRPHTHARSRAYRILRSREAAILALAKPPARSISTRGGHNSPHEGDSGTSHVRDGQRMRHGEVIQRMEYRVLVLRENVIGGALSGDKLEDALNEQARQGWLLKSITHADVKGRVGPGAVEGLILTFERSVS